MRTFGPTVLLALTCACVSPTGDGARIVLERAEREGWWRATYLLDSPAGELRFQRPARFFREEVWEVATPGWRLERRDEHQLLVADTDDTAASRVAVEFPVHTDHLVKEYEFFQKFTDGSLAVYTGHLYVTPDEADRLQRVELVPRDDEHLVVRGRLTRGRTIWDDPDGDGTYVYFGRIDPLETEEMIAVVDPGAPSWLVQQMHRLLPEMFAMYSEGFGEPLPWKPMVLFNFENVERGGLSSGGGTLTGLVQMSATGSAWHDATPESSEHLLYLIAHEAAHLWNGQLHAYDDSADSWMHEGSADAFAELALLRSGAIDATRLAERRTEALNRCVRGLGGGALYDSAQRGQFRNYYACGNILAVWSFAMLSRPAEFGRLFDVWRGVFANANAENSHYDRDSYFRALESLGVEADAIDRLAAFVDETLDDPTTDVLEFLGIADIEVVALDRPWKPERRERAAAALEHLMELACGGRVSFYREWPMLRTAAIDGCEPFEREMRILTIQGYDVASDGDRALQSMAERCRSGLPVTLRLEDRGRAAIPCNAAPAPPPPPLAFPEI